MALIDTVTSMAEEVTERQRREETNARRRAQRQAAREAEAARESEASESNTNSLLGFATGGPHNAESVRARYSTRDRMRERGRPEAAPRFNRSGSEGSNGMESMDVASYHNSRYAGNADDQGQPYYMPPPVDVGYDIGTVLANMNQRFLENREQVHKQRAIQVAQFQAANRVRQEQSQSETPGVVNPAPGSENPGGPSTMGNTTEPPQTNSPVDNTGGFPGQSGPYGGGGLPITGMPQPGDVMSQVNRWNTPQPILWQGR